MERYPSEAEVLAIKQVAHLMVAAARTAPKTRGIDNLEMIILEGEDKDRLIPKMIEIAKRYNRPSCERDAHNIKEIHLCVIIGTKIRPLGLNCGFCGFRDCKELESKKGVCAYNSMDLGIALGSAANIASQFHIDNRLMYSIGKAALELGFFSNEVKQAVGIPLSVTGKNIFFDRRK